MVQENGAIIQTLSFLSDADGEYALLVQMPLAERANGGSWAKATLGVPGGRGRKVEGFRAPAGVRKSYKYDPR
ncbi:hypothetical protein ABIC78_003443 [Novosphingobium sp. 1529]|uniref:hypothetical protein n=1 Tax=Novosphingobium sp. 1529 TaxID=3156424 RepID=UPI0033952933